jgi:ribose 5-phosphate isomerase B
MGSSTKESCDYPDFSVAVADAVSKGKCAKGVLICGTGVGMSIAANKFPGVRAAICWNDEVAALISQHNDANIICLPGRFASTAELTRWINIWLNTPASTEERHVKRINKIRDLDKKLCE